MENRDNCRKPWNWKGVPIVASNGYILIFVGKSHRLADVRGYAYEHRLVAEKILGRRLRDGEQVHHKDGDKANNQPGNIEVYASIADHRFTHRRRDSKRRRPREANPMVACDCGCGSRFRRYDSSGRPRLFVSGHNSHLRRKVR